MQQSASRACVLTIAGSDSGGASGLQADLRTFAAFGLHGLSVVTAVTAQNLQSVSAVHALPARQVAAQLQALLDGFDIRAVKIGMLGSAAVVDAVADVLERERSRLRPVVLDPVLVSTSGAPLLTRPARARLRTRLLPLADLLTPNLPEAEALLGISLADADAREAAARALLALGPRAVLLKGGHADGEKVYDRFVPAKGPSRVFAHTRLPIAARGTGCTLASAIAAGLANGQALPDAVQAAERYLQRSLRRAYRVGGQGRHVL
ncbi:MAG TPA: bifunctional hydroxymethylpyrimidine kinase/phosphomethylpyrimidine kinase, partial [Rudaea sp.]